MTKFVYDFTEGNKDLKDLLGGKGANLAEMTNLGLPVPPGLHHHHRGVPGLPRARRRARRSCADEVSEHLARAREGDGHDGSATPTTRCWSRVRSGAKFSMPGHDGDGPQHRPQRRVGAGPGQAGRQRAVRLGLLPPADPDVRQDRARHRRRALRATRSTRPRRPRAPTNDLDLDADDLRGLVDDVQGASSREHAGRDFPQDPREQLDLADPRRLRLVERRPRAILYRRQERIPADLGTAVNIVRDGLRQPRHGLRHRRRLHPRPRHRRTRASTATTCRTRRARTSSPASATPSRCRTSRASTRRPTTSCMAIMADAGEPLPRPVRHRVHHRARQAVDAADPGRQAHRRRRRSGSPPSWSTRA